MSLDSKVVDYLTGVGASVDADHNQLVNLPIDHSKAGYARATTRLHDGLSGYNQAIDRDMEVSINKRLRVGMDNIWFQDRFSYAAQWTAVWKAVLTTFTVTHVGGFLVLNGSNLNTAAAVANYETYKHFPCFNGAGLAFEAVASFTQPAQTGCMIEIGMFQAATTASPIDGVLFRINAAGAFLGVCNFNGSESTTDLGILPTDSVEHTFGIRMEQEQVMFLLDGVVRGVIDTPVGSQGPTMNMYVPVHFRLYNQTAPSLAVQLKVGEARVFLRDVVDGRDFEQTMVGMGGMGCQGHAGATQGSTALMTNSLAAGAGVAASNTAAALGSGLGGQFALQPTLLAGTDGIVSSFQVPLGTAFIPGESLVITGMWVDALVTTALTGGPCHFAMSLAIGGTNVSLATAEAAAAKAPRRIPLGFLNFPVTSPVGQAPVGGKIFVPFASKITAYPGEFVQVVAKNVGMVTTAGVVLFLIGFDSHWE